jgi:hypothetical protein
MIDDLLLTRDCLPEQPPPAPDVTAAARDRLSQLARAPARRATSRPARHTTRRVFLAGMRPARRALLLRAAMPAAAVAAAAGVVVAIAAVIPAAAPQRTPSAAGTPTARVTTPTARVTTPPPAGGPAAGYRHYAGAVPAASAGGTTDGRAVLLRAATAVGRATTSAPERYWVTTGTIGTFVQLGPIGDRYMVLEEAGVQDWAARSPRDRSPSLAQALGAAPVSAADRAAWQRDGSPTAWPYAPQSDQLADPQGYSGGFLYALTTVGGPVSSLDASYGSQQFDVGAHSLTLAQLRALPADPAKLEKLIKAGGIAPGETLSAYLLQTVPAIMQMPVTPAVRAAFYQMLASMPGMESLGQVTDPAGRQGEAVGYTASYGNCQPSTLPGSGNGAPQFSSCTTQEILIIDPATGMPMAEELRYVGLPSGDQWPAPDGLFAYEIFGQSYATDDNPPKPANPPHPPQPSAAPHSRPSVGCTFVKTPASTKAKCGQGTVP